MELTLKDFGPGFPGGLGTELSPDLGQREGKENSGRKESSTERARRESLWTLGMAAHHIKRDNEVTGYDA
jgi:hypothetical protein